MSDEVLVTSDERESPRPWRLGDETTHPNFVEDANGRVVAAWISHENAELIIRAVNDRDALLKAHGMLQEECRALAAEANRMAELVRRLCDMVADHPIWRPSESEQWLICEARKAIEKGGAE